VQANILNNSISPPVPFPFFLSSWNLIDILHLWCSKASVSARRGRLRPICSVSNVATWRWAMHCTLATPNERAERQLSWPSSPPVSAWKPEDLPYKMMHFGPARNFSCDWGEEPCGANWVPPLLCGVICRLSGYFLMRIDLTNDLLCFYFKYCVDFFLFSRQSATAKILPIIAWFLVIVSVASQVPSRRYPLTKPTRQLVRSPHVIYRGWKDETRGLAVRT